MTHLMTPLAVDRTHVECAWAFPSEVAARPDFDPSYAVDFWDLTNRQDWAACESVQRGLSSPHARPVRWHPTRTASTSSSPVLPVHTRAVPALTLLILLTRRCDRRGDGRGVGLDTGGRGRLSLGLRLGDRAWCRRLAHARATIPTVMFLGGRRSRGRSG
jgi:hypothetical protein